MIGEKVPKEQLEELLVEETRRDEFLKELNKELKALEPGECLVYEAKVGMESILSLVLTLSHIKNLKLIDRPGKVFAYKEC